MGGAAAGVDVEAVGIGVDDVGLGAQGVKDGLGNVPGRAVGTVQRDALALEGIQAQGDQVADVAVAAGDVIDRTANVLTVSKGYLRQGLTEDRHAAVQVLLHQVDGFLVHLFALAVDEFNAVVKEGVMAGGDHDAAVKFIHAGNIGHRGRRGDVEHIGVRAGGDQTCHQGILEHIGGAAGVLADDDTSFFIAALAALLFPEIPAQETADLISMISSQIDICFPTEAIGAEILSHHDSPLSVSCRHSPQA